MDILTTGKSEQMICIAIISFIVSILVVYSAFQMEAEFLLARIYLAGAIAGIGLILIATLIMAYLNRQIIMESDLDADVS